MGLQCHKSVNLVRIGEGWIDTELKNHICVPWNKSPKMGPNTNNILNFSMRIFKNIYVQALSVANSFFKYNHA